MELDFDDLNHVWHSPFPRNRNLQKLGGTPLLQGIPMEKVTKLVPGSAQ